MDTEHVRDGVAFVWDENKAVANRAKHGISFDQAIEAFFDPFVRVVDAGIENESRDALIGMDESFRLLFVVHLELEDEAYRIVSARRATAQERRTYETIRRRLARDRPMSPVTLRMPEDVIEDLKTLAPLLGFSGYQPLIRAYVGQGMREDQKRLDTDRLGGIVAALRRRGVSEELIAEALAEADGRSAA